MRTVHKFTLDTVVETQQLSLPVGADVVHVGLQADMVTLWVELDTEVQTKMLRPFRLCMTGGRIPEGFEYRGTIRNNGIVVHVYEGPLH